MLLAAFFDLGLPTSKVRACLRQLGIEEDRFSIRQVRRDGAAAVQLRVVPSRRPLPARAGQILACVKGSALPASVRGRMERVLRRLARAEGETHRRPWEAVRFHQLAGVDTWLSLVGFCAGLDHFGIRACRTGPVPVGSLFQDERGGRRLRPGPATLRLLKGFRLERRPFPFEWTTPTGAALLAAFARREGTPPLRVIAVGCGAGRHRPPRGPSALRLLLGEET